LVLVNQLAAQHLPDRGCYVAHVATPGPLATTSVDATRANGGTRGRHLPNRGQATLTGGADRVNATRANVGYVGGNGGIRRIAARPLTLTGGADRVGVRLPGDAGAAVSTCRIAAKRIRSQAAAQATTPVNAARANVDAVAGMVAMAAPAGSRPRGTSLHPAARDKPRLPPVNAARANGGQQGREWCGRDPVGSTCRIAAGRLRSQAVPIVWVSGWQPLPDPGQAADAHRRDQPLPDPGQAAASPPWPTSRRPASWYQRRGLRPGPPHGRDWATWAGTWAAPAGSRLRRPRRPRRDAGQSATGTRLPPVNAARAHGGTRGRERRHLPDRGQRLTLTGGAYRVSVRPPDRGQRLCSQAGPLATTPVNVARANGGGRGREWRHLPDRGQLSTSPTSRHRGHSRHFCP